jgi:catechol-2,3-dioxygenase
MPVDFNAPVDKVISPQKLAHVVLQTSQFEAMVTYYKTFLGAEASYENAYLSFLTYDDEHHRIAIAGIPGLSPKSPTSSGLAHIAFTFPTLEDLALAYRQRKAKGIEPFWAVNHGPTMSIYYQDPDGNQIETQVDNFETAEQANEFMASKAFAENPIGVDFDPEELIRKLTAGEDQIELKKRPNIGPRGLDTIPQPPPIVMKA